MKAIVVALVLTSVSVEHVAKAQTTTAADLTTGHVHLASFRFAEAASTFDSVTTDKRHSAAERLRRFYSKYSSEPPMRPLLFTAAYRLGALERAKRPGDARVWWKRAAELAAVLDNSEPRRMELAAEAAFRLIDDELDETWEREPNRKGYRCGVLAHAVATFENDFAKAGSHADRLRHVAESYPNTVFAGVATARAGRLYDGAALELYRACPQGVPAVNYPPSLGVDAVRHRRRELLARAFEQVVRHYALAVAMAPQHSAAKLASRRLAFYSELLADSTIRDIVTSTPDPRDPTRRLSYEPHQFLLNVSGLSATSCDPR